MKKMFLYLFVFSLLVNIFLLIYSTKKLKFETERYSKLNEKFNHQRDTITQLRTELTEADYFSLKSNEAALEYLYRDGIKDSKDIMSKIQDTILSYNEKENGNPLITYDPIGTKVFLINKIKFLNHRWIIADFSNGDIWGELLLKYFINDDGSFYFEPLNSVIYLQE